MSLKKKDQLVLVLLLLSFGGVLYFLLEFLRTKAACPDINLSLPAGVIVVLFHKSVLKLWHERREMMLAAALSGYAVIGFMLWASLSGRLSR